MQNQDERKAVSIGRRNSGRGVNQSPAASGSLPGDTGKANALPARRPAKQMEAEPPQGEKGDIPRV